MTKCLNKRLKFIISPLLIFLLAFAQLAGVVVAVPQALAAPTFSVTPYASTSASLPVRITVSASENAFTAGNSTPYLRQGSATVDANISAVTSTSTEVSFTVGAGLGDGTYSIRIVSPAGTYDVGTFRIGSPSIQGVNPASLASNYEQQGITVTGTNTNFSLGQSVVEILNSANQVMGKVGGVTGVALPTELAFTLQSGLASGSYKVRVTTGQEVVTSGLILQVRNAPTITISPSKLTEGYANATITVTGTDTSFSAATTVNVLDNSGNATGKAGAPTVASATSLSFTLSSGLAAGNYTVRVTTGSEVVTKALTIAAPSASLKYQGNNFTQLGTGYNSSYTLTVAGTNTNFSQGTTQIALFDPYNNNVTAGLISNVSVSNATTASFSLNTGIDETGTYTVRVTTGQEAVNTTFQVVAPTLETLAITSPVADGTTLPKGYADTQVNVVAQNSAFSASTTAAVVDQADKTSAITVSDATHLTFTLKSGLNPGSYTIRIDVDGNNTTTTDRMEETFTVTAPAIKTVLPGTVINSSPAPVTITVEGDYTHFSVGTPVIDIDGFTGETINNVTAVDDDTVTFSLTPNSITTPGTYDVMVSTNSAAITETVLASDVLTVNSSGISSISPNTIYIDELDSRSVTVVGQNTAFQAGITKVKIDAGEPLNSITVSSATSLAFTVPRGLSSGTHTLYIDQDNDGTYDFNNTFSVAQRTISLSGSSMTFNYSEFNLTVTGSGVAFESGSKPVIKVLKDSAVQRTVAASDITVLEQTKVRFPFPTGLASGDYTVQVSFTAGQYAGISLEAPFTVNHEVNSLYFTKDGQTVTSLDATVGSASFDLSLFGRMAAGGADQDKTEAAAWEVTSGASVVSVNNTSNKGQVTILGPGSATIRGTYDGRSASITITVTSTALPGGTSGPGGGGGSLPQPTPTNEDYKEAQDVVNDSSAAPDKVAKAAGDAVKVFAGLNTASAADAQKIAADAGTVVGILSSAATRVASESLVAQVTDNAVKVVDTLAQASLKANANTKALVLENTVKTVEVLAQLIDKGSSGNAAVTAKEIIGSTSLVKGTLSDAGERKKLEDAVLGVAETAIARAGTKTLLPSEVALVNGKVTLSLNSSDLSARMDSFLNAKEEVVRELTKNDFSSNLIIPKKVTVEVPVLAGTTSVEAKLPTGVLETANSKGIEKVEVKTEVASIAVPPQAFGEEMRGKEISLSAAKLEKGQLPQALQSKVPANSIVVDLNALAGGTKVSQFKKPLEVSVPYTLKADENPLAVTVFLLKDNGELEPVGGKFDKAAGRATFITSHFSKYFAQGSVKTFADIAKLVWAKEQIGILAGKGIISGKGLGKFAPNDNITRAEFATLIVKMLKLEGAEGSLPFKDVNPGSWYYPYVKSAYNSGLIKGKSAVSFDPNGNITRQEMAAIISNVLISKGYNAPGEAELNRFSDASSIANWAKNAAALSAKEGIVSGSDGKFQPNAKATRAQAAVMLYNLFRID